MIFGAAPMNTNAFGHRSIAGVLSQDSRISHKLLAIVFSGNLVGFPVCGFWSGHSWFSWEFLTEAAAESLSWSFWPLARQKYLCLSRRWGPNQKQGQKSKHLKKVEQFLLDTCMSGMWHFCIYHPERRSSQQFRRCWCCSGLGRKNNHAGDVMTSLAY